MSSFGRKMWALPLMICLTLITVCTFGFAGCGEAVTYKVTFFANGGYFQDLEGTTEKDTKYTIEVKSGEKIDSEIIDNLKSKIKRESSNTLRFTFDGWDFDASTSIQEEMTINAKWTESTRKYTTEFVASGGKYTVGDEQKDSLEYSNEYNTNCAVPSNPTRDADNNYTYTFAGYLPAISEGTTSLVVTQDKTYTAQWNQVEQKYSITFNANGGYFGTATETTFTATDATYQKTLADILSNNNKKATPTATTTHYYVFDGWYTAKTGGDKITSVSDITTVSKDSKSATVYAHWNEMDQLYKITFDADQGQFTPTEKLFVVADAKYSDELANILSTAQKPAPIRAATDEKEYTFEGWYSDENFTKKVTKISDIMDATQGTTYATVYAKYTEADQEYSITFDANGGYFGEDVAEFTQNSAKYTDSLETILTTASKTATKAEDIYYTYSLRGWYTAKTGGTQVTEISDIMHATQGTTSATVYARWSSTIKTYRVEFNGNGGKIDSSTTYTLTKMNSTSDMQYCVNQAKNINRDPWTDKNYEFLGWSTQQEGGSVLSEDDLNKKVAEFITATDVKQTELKLYAQWGVISVARACDASEPYIVSDLASFEAMIEKLNDSYDEYSEESDATKKASILKSASEVYYQITANINLTNLQAPGKWFVGHLDARATDDTNYKIWGMQAENFKSTEGAIFNTAYDSIISNLDIGLIDKIVTFAMLGYGDYVEFNNVDIYGVSQYGSENKNATILISADDNNESAYMSQSFAGSLKFINCDNYANYMSECSYFGVFLGGYTRDYQDIRVNHPEDSYKSTLVFDSCVNYGNITSSGSVGILTGNSYERNFTYSEDLAENTITITNCKNEGIIKAQSYGGFVGFARNDTANPTAGIYPELNKTLSAKVEGMTDALCSVLPKVTGTLSLNADNKYTLTNITGGVQQGKYRLTVVAFASSAEKGTIRLNYSTEATISATETNTTSIIFDRGKYDFIDSTSYSALPLDNSILDDSSLEWNEMTGYNIKYAFDDTNKYIVFDFTDFSYGPYTINSPSITIYLECYTYNDNNKLELTSVTKTNDSSLMAQSYGVDSETALRKAVSDGKEYIFVTKDINVDGEYISINKDTYINLGGHTITANKGFDVAYGNSDENSKKARLYLCNGTLEVTNFAVWVQNAGKLFIRNAIVNTNSYAATIVIAGNSSSTTSDENINTKPTVVLGEGAVVSNTFSGKSLIDPTDESQGYTNTATITVHDGGQLALLPGSTVRYIGENQEAIAVQVDNATLASFEDSLIYSNAYGVVVANEAIADIEGIIYSRHYAISTDEREGCGNVQIEISDGAKVISTRSAAVYMSNSGNLYISGGYIEGATALYIKSGTTKITGGNFIAWYGELLEFYHKDFGCKSTGDVIVIEACGCAGGAPTVTIGESADELSKIQFTHYAEKATNVRYIQYNGSAISTVTVGGVSQSPDDGTYTAVFKEAGSIVDGFPVMATTGGYAQMIGQNASEIADADTITVSTYVTDTNYEFVGWYLDNDRSNCLSTAYSCRIAKSVAYKHTLVAVYKLKTETGTNGQTGN